MNGIPFEIVHESEHDDVETVYLSTVRTGPEGANMQAARADLAKAGSEHIRALRDTSVCADLLRGLDPKRPGYPEEIRALSLKQDDALERSLAASARVRELTEKIVRISLSRNYPRDRVDSILDRMTDADLRACVSLIECGEPPEGFVRPADRGIRPKPNTTPRSGALPTVLSSAPDSHNETFCGDA